MKYLGAETSYGNQQKLAVQCGWKKKAKALSTVVNETKTKGRACGALWC
jgi:hypothetical protein